LKTIVRNFAAALLVLAAQPAFAETLPISVAGTGIVRTAQFKNWKVNLDTPHKIGTVSRGLFCSNLTDLAYTKPYNDALARELAIVFKERSEALGYPKYVSDDSAFASQSSSNSADLRVGFSLTAMENNFCMLPPELSGNARIMLKAEVFSNQLQKVVYSRSIQGSFASSGKMKDTLFHKQLLTIVLDQMFADPAYVAAFRDSGPAVAADTSGQLAVKNGNKPKDMVKNNSKGLLSAVVTVENAGVSGSGFYIGGEGYVISNQHVVGDAKYVKIRLPGGYAVPGEVVRRDVARDVALIKTNIEPPVPVFIRRDSAKVGDEVYAVGSPFGSALSNTVTRGVFSGVRKTNEQTYIQSDVAVNPGNSGGPLVDADGALIGIAAKKMQGDGIGMFIPINEALETLGLNLQ
jgi:serine protease Do